MLLFHLCKRRGARHQERATTHKHDQRFCFCILAIDAAESVCGPEDTMGKVEGMRATRPSSRIRVAHQSKDTHPNKN